jgi:hypothetical protein
LPSGHLTSNSRTRQMQEDSDDSYSRAASHRNTGIGCWTSLPVLHLLVLSLLSMHGMEVVQLVHHSHLFPLLAATDSAINHPHHWIVKSIFYSIEYDQFFKGKHITESVYLVVEEIYFIFAILVSHYIYRVFKSHSNGDGLIFNNNPPPAAPPQGEYRALVEENPPNQQARAFQGQGVMIG